MPASLASVSSATPSGPVAFPRASRHKALRNVSIGQPNWSASDAAMAASEAMMPAVESAL